MKRHTVDFDRFDVVAVPFPFTDKAQAKRRPALVLSSASGFGRAAGHSVMAMITSAKNPPWPLDVWLADLLAAGLPAPSIVRMKLFTLDHRFVLARRGRLADKDRKGVTKSLATLLAL
jgi:mRNA interferase MazF